MTAGNDRRRSLRSEARDLSVMLDYGFESEAYRCENISATGAALSGPLGVGVGRRARLCVSVPDRVLLSLRARVVALRRIDGRDHVAIEFEGVPPSDKLALTRLCVHLLRCRVAEESRLALVVDRSPWVRAGLCGVLGFIGARPVAVASALEAITRLDEALHSDELRGTTVFVGRPMGSVNGVELGTFLADELPVAQCVLVLDEVADPSDAFARDPRAAQRLATVGKPWTPSRLARFLLTRPGGL